MKSKEGLSKDLNLPDAPLVECYKLRIVGVVEMILFFLCLVFNSMLLKMFIRNKKFHTPLNVLIIILTCFNFFGSLLEFPFIILSNLYCR